MIRGDWCCLPVEDTIRNGRDCGLLKTRSHILSQGAKELSELDNLLPCKYVCLILTHLSIFKIKHKSLFLCELFWEGWINIFCWLYPAQGHTRVNLSPRTLFKYCILCNALSYSSDPVGCSLAPHSWTDWQTATSYHPEASVTRWTSCGA